MDRLTEERHRNEVLYLHSLFRQGPPVPNPNPYPITNQNRPIPNPNPYPVTNQNLPILNPNPYPIGTQPRPFLNPNPHFPNFIHNPDPIIPTIPFSNSHRYTHNPNLPNFNSNPNPIIPIIPISNPHPYTHNPNLPNFRPYNYVPRNSNLVNPTNVINKFRRLSVSTQLTKGKMKKKKKNGKKGVGNDGEGKKWPPISDNEWPCNPTPEPTSGWPTLNLNPTTPVNRVLTAQENASMVATQSQQKALNAVREMFQKRMDSDGEVDDDDEDDMMDDDDSVDDDDAGKEYKFFLKVFMEDIDLRSYYEKNCESGEFSCLVCGGTGEKVGKKFKDCVALVQHSITIAKTKKRHAHRALGKVICKVLGWDIEKLPSVNLPKISDSEGNGPHEVLPDKAVNLTTVAAAELMVCEVSQHPIMVSDGNKSLINLDNGTPSTAEGDENGTVNGLCRNLTKTMVSEVTEMK